MGTTRRTDGALLALAVVAVSTSAPLIRQASAPALAIAFWRNAFAAAAVVPLAVTRERAELAAARQRVRGAAVAAGMFLAAHFAAWIPSVSFTSVASSVALVATQPVWAALIARVRGDHVGAGTWAGIAVALAGVAVLTGVDLSFSVRALGGDLLAVAGGILAAAYVTVGAEVRAELSTVAYTAVCYSAAAAALFASCLASRTPIGGFDGRTWWLLVAITAGPQLLGHSLFNRVLRTLRPTVVSVAILFEIVGAALLAWWWFGETPPPGALPAAALIGAGVVLVVRDTMTPATSAVPAVE